MPTKNDWRDKSDLSLIERSALELQGLSIFDFPEDCDIFMPMPGCSNGGLDYKTQVRPILKNILDDRFVVLWYD